MKSNSTVAIAAQRALTASLKQLVKASEALGDHRDAKEQSDDYDPALDDDLEDLLEEIDEIFINTNITFANIRKIVSYD